MTIPPLHDDRSEKVKRGADVLQAFRNLSEAEKRVIAADLMWSLTPVYESLGHKLVILSWKSVQRARTNWSNDKALLFFKRYGQKMQEVALERTRDVVQGTVYTFETEFESGG